MTTLRIKGKCRRWCGRIGWMVALWASGVLALAVFSGLLHWLMHLAAPA